jgi:hypothetical protein
MSGCGKGVFPTIDILISTSQLIYLAEEKNNEYYVRSILKLSQDSPLVVTKGQRVVLHYEMRERRPPTHPHRIVVFVFREDGRPGSGQNYGHAEIPLTADLKLVSYKIEYEQLLDMLGLGKVDPHKPTKAR